MARDEPVADLHHLDEVHLVAVRRLAGVLPDEPGPVGDVPRAVAAARGGLVREHLLDEPPQLLPAAHHAVGRAEQVADERALQDGVGVVQREHRLEVLRAQRLVPGRVDVLDLLGRVHGTDVRQQTFWSGPNRRRGSLDGVFDGDLAPVASLIGDPARSAMLAALAEGHALPAGEPARRAGIHPATATGHLAARLIRVGGTAPPAPRAPAAPTAGTPAGCA